MFFGTSILDGFWETKILDFHTFFIIFSMQNLECNLEGQNIEKKGFKIFFLSFFSLVQRYVRPRGEGL